MRKTNFLEKIRMEIWILLSLLMTTIAFTTHYFMIGNQGISILDSVFGEKIGWLFYALAFIGYFFTLILISYDKKYSHRAKLSYAATLLFLFILFLFLVIRMIVDHVPGITHFGFAFYWFIFHFLVCGAIFLLYSGFSGTNEPTLYQWIVAYSNEESSNKPKKGISNLKKYEELEKAKDLYDRGIFTEEEFLKEKKDILEKY